MNTLFDRLFPAGHDIGIDTGLVLGGARMPDGPVHVLGSCGGAELDATMTLRLSRALLDAMVADAAPRPVVFIADTRGQVLSRHEELLCLNASFAHLARCVDLARRRGHRLVSVVHGEAVSGGFLAFGLLADRICALPGAQVKVMDLRAMARVTKIDPERLEALAAHSPVFAPGADNYWRMGGLHDIWQDEDDWAARLAAAIAAATGRDARAALGLQRGGRACAADVAARVCGEAPT